MDQNGILKKWIYDKYSLIEGVDGKNEEEIIQYILNTPELAFIRTEYYSKWRYGDDVNDQIEIKNDKNEIEYFKPLRLYSKNIETIHIYDNQVDHNKLNDFYLKCTMETPNNTPDCSEIAHDEFKFQFKGQSFFTKGLKILLNTEVPKSWEVIKQNLFEYWFGTDKTFSEEDIFNVIFTYELRHNMYHHPNGLSNIIAKKARISNIGHKNYNFFGGDNHTTLTNSLKKQLLKEYTNHKINRYIYTMVGDNLRYVHDNNSYNTIFINPSPKEFRFHDTHRKVLSDGTIFFAPFTNPENSESEFYTLNDKDDLVQIDKTDTTKSDPSTEVNSVLKTFYVYYNNNVIDENGNNKITDDTVLELWKSLGSKKLVYANEFHFFEHLSVTDKYWELED
jgi:hypothetical protein